MIQIKLKQIMKDRGLTYREVSQGASISTGSLYKMRENKQRYIDLEALDRITDFLRCDLSELIVKKTNGSDPNTL